MSFEIFAHMDGLVLVGIAGLCAAFVVSVVSLARVFARARGGR
jgi:hypothetical protein